MRWINLVFPGVVILGLLVLAYLYFFTKVLKVSDF
jgi:hypothetical protein